MYLPCLSCRFLTRALGLSIALFALVAAAAADEPAVSRDDAIFITTETLLGGSTEGVRLFVYPEVVPAGEVVSTWKRDVFAAPADGWFLFVDRYPGANWEHPCQYVFVDAFNGELSAYDAMVPPRWQPELVEITDGRDNPPPGASERELARMKKRLSELPKPEPLDRGRAFAFIISGGANMSNNHIRYWNDSAFIYTCLAEYYGYPDENIYVCISDGLDPAPDRSNGTNSPPDLDGDGDDDIQYPATYVYIEQVFNELATILMPSDQLFIFTTDHGGQEAGWDCYLNLWNLEELRDDQLAAFVDALPCQTVICTFEQCFSGGMIDDLEGEGRVISTAAAWNEYSWAMGPDYIYDTYVYFWTSAVNWADPYGNYVDADTDDDGIVSMHEAFLYAEANDHEQETPQYSSTPQDLGDLLSLFGSMEGVYLTVEDVVVDDDMTGASYGDGDGIIEFNETIEMTITLHNMGLEDALGVTGVLSSPSDHIVFIEDEASFGDIPSEGNGANAEPLIFRIAHDVPNGEDLDLTLEVNVDPGTIPIGMLALAPEYVVGILEIDDSSGNGDGIPNPGEEVGLTLWIENDGGCPTPEIEVTLEGACEFFDSDETPHPLGVLAVGEGVSEGGFTVSISPGCPEVYSNYLRLHAWGPDFYHRYVPVVFSVGQIFADDMESGGTSWTHYPGPGSWTDEWHLETYRNHTPAGLTSWKCGGLGAAQYGNLLYACLETAPFELPAASRLNFWHWCDAETSNAHSGYCYDGGLLEISTDGGMSWEGLSPDDGYPFLVRAGGTPGPFAAETPVWSGRHDWREVGVDLGGYEGTVRLRWAFGSDGAEVREGWYVDDVRIYTRPPAVVDDTDGGELIRPVLLAASPNPAWLGRGAAGGGAAVQIGFALPRTAPVSLRLYDPSGRLLRTLAEGQLAAGPHQVGWDGRDAAGHLVAAGSYYYRLTADHSALGGRIIVLR